MQYKISFSKNKPLGLTLVEIVIVIAILGVISLVTYQSLFNVNQKEVLEKETSRISAIIERARSLTLSSSGDSAYGVHIESDRLVTFPGSSYDSSDPDNRVDTLNSKISILSHALSGGGDDIVFKRLTGNTDENGNLFIGLSSTTTVFYTITVYKTGLVDVQ